MLRIWSWYEIHFIEYNFSTSSIRSSLIEKFKAHARNIEMSNGTKTGTSHYFISNTCQSYQMSVDLRRALLLFPHSPSTHPHCLDGIFISSQIQRYKQWILFEILIRSDLKIEIKIYWHRRVEVFLIKSKNV